VSNQAFLDSAQIDYMNRVLHEAYRESDRAAAILIGAEIDSALRSLIQAFILPPTNKSTNLLQSDAPLGTMASRIEIAYRLGLISVRLHRELHLLRRVRNEFAHHLAGFGFGDSPARDLCYELAIPQWVLDGRPELSAELSLNAPRNRFTLSGACGVALLSGLPPRVETVSPKAPEFGDEEDVA